MKKQGRREGEAELATDAGFFFFFAIVFTGGMSPGSLVIAAREAFFFDFTVVLTTFSVIDFTSVLTNLPVIDFTSLLTNLPVRGSLSFRWICFFEVFFSSCHGHQYFSIHLRRKGFPYHFPGLPYDKYGPR